MMFRPFGATAPHTSRHTRLPKGQRIVSERLKPLRQISFSDSLPGARPRRERGVPWGVESFPKGASCAAPASQRRGTKKMALRPLRLWGTF